MAEGKEYFIRVRGALVAVTPDIYHVCHKTKRQAKTLYEKDSRHDLVSYNSLDTTETLGVETIADSEAVSVEDAALHSILLEQLRICLVQLPSAEQELLHALYFEELSERETAQKLGLHHMTVHNRKVRILEKLKKMMNT